MSDRLYDKDRDIIAQGQHYVRHVEAMTAEDLHSKSDIAAELAHRDIEIERLRATVSRCVLNDPPGDCYAAEVVELRARLAEAERLLDNWLRWAEHRDLTQDQFNDLVWDSQALCDADQPTADRENDDE